MQSISALTRSPALRSSLYTLVARTDIARTVHRGGLRCMASQSSDVPKSRTQGAHNFLVQEHGASSIKMLVGAAAALSVAHLAMDPVSRVESVRNVIHYLSLVWFGSSFAIGFVEAPAKFQAPTLTRPVALDVGRHVFSAMNKLEVPAACALAYAYAIGATSGAGYWPLVPLACVAVETAWFMPGLMKRAATVIAGGTIQKNSLHTLNSLSLVAKLSALMAVAIFLK